MGYTLFLLAMTLSTTSDRINAQGGLFLVGKALDKACQLPELFSGERAAHNQQFTDCDILKAAIGLLAQGRTHFSDAELFRQEGSGIMTHALGLNGQPSEATFRQRFEKLAKRDTISTALSQANQNLLKTIKPTSIKVGGRHFIPNDIDVTPMNNAGSNREHVSYTYKGFDGYAPIMSNLGAEGYLLHHELRPGSQHSQKGTPKFLEENFRLIDELKLEQEVLVRMDSGNDSADTIQALRDSGHAFIVKRNIRRESEVKWLGHAKALGTPETPRKGKEIYYGSVDHYRPGGEKSTQEPLPCIYKVTERSIDKDGNELLFHDVEVELYWTNLGDPAQEVIELYHDHATSEQFHSELKTDMSIERFPSKYFEVNELFLMLGAIAYNILRVIDSHVMGCVEGWPVFYRKRGLKQSRRRVGSIMRDFIFIGAKVVKHGGRITLKLSGHWPWTKTLLRVSKAL